MAALNEDDDDVLRIVRRTNKALRTVNRQLQRKIKRLEQQRDDDFIDLCETESNEGAAEKALWTLWKEGGLESVCSSEDFTKIVDVSVQALTRLLTSQPKA